MRTTTPAFVTLMALTMSSGCDQTIQEATFARASVVGGLDQVVGGEKAIGRSGDLLLENDHFRAVILSGRASKGPGLYGGSIVDADLQVTDVRRKGGRGRDAFAELFPTVNLNVSFADQPASVTVRSSGEDGGAAVVRVRGSFLPFLTLLDALWALVSMPDMWIDTDYIAEPGVPWMTLRTTVSFQENPDTPEDATEVQYAEESLDVIRFALEEGLVMGDFFLGGGSVDVFAPGIGFDEDGAVFRANEEGVNTFTDPLRYPFLAAVADGVSYGIVPKAGNLFVPLFTASQTVVMTGFEPGAATGPRFAPNSSYVYERYFLLGYGDVGSIVDQYIDIRAVPHGTVHGRVLEQGSGWPMDDYQVFVFEPGAEYPWSQWATDVHPDDELIDGSFGGKLPVGTWELLAHQQGRPDGQRITVEVTEGEEVKVRMEAPRPGMVTFTIRDEVGEHIPAKLSVFKAASNNGPANRRPALGDPFIGGDPEWVVFADRGTGEIALPPGEYYAVASRGLEYEIDRTDAFLIDANTSQHLDLQVERSIETDGWVAADFHVHSAPSHDSGVTLDMRVRTMVCEGVEFFAATDHDFLSDFAPVVEEMGLEEWIQAAVGVETTTIELGHFLGFPMQRDFLGDVGGAMDWTGMTPIEIVEGLRQQGKDAGFDPVVFVGHPRDGILGYFDQYGFDPFSGGPGAPVFAPSLITQLVGNPLQTTSSLTMDFDAIEMFTGKRMDLHRTPTHPELESYAASGDDAEVYDWMTRTMEEQEALIEGTYRLTGELDGNIDDWFSLLNLGYRFTILGNSDTHGLTSVEAGCPRNYVMSETDDPGFLSDQGMADAVKDHRVVVSYGPFLRMWVEGEPVGSDVVADGEVEIQLEVQAPSWVDVDRVELYENGTLIAEWPVEAGTSSNLRFYEELTVTPDRDSWYAAIAMGQDSLAPVFTAVEIPYIPLDEAVTGSLGGLAVVGSLLGEPVPFPKKYPVYPFAITNPVWVDVDGGGFEPPGLPDWLQPHEAEE